MSDKQLTFGNIIGHAFGNVPVYSCDYRSINNQDFITRESFRNYVEGVYTGYKWQCVEFVRRWLYQVKGYVFEDIPMAYDIFAIKHVTSLSNKFNLPMKSFVNGSRRLPTVGSILVWRDVGCFELTGHVAIITEVTESSVRIAEQNFNNILWSEGQDYSRELRAKKDEFGGYWIACTEPGADILGWVIQTDDETYAHQIEETDPKYFQIKHEYKKQSSDSKKGWLNVANLDEDAFVSMNNYSLLTDPSDEGLYFLISESAEKEIKRATNELHAMFMQATDFVLKSDERLARFSIPKCLWPKIRMSWENRRNENITGRFDFCLTKEGLKLYEYNIDTCSCYLETAKIQGKWAKHNQCDFGKDPGALLSRRLIDCWRNSDASGLLHILTDERDKEEIYHSYYMQSLIEEAGIKTKIIKNIAELSIQPETNKLIDLDGNKVRWIWKTWAWETAIQQIRDDLENDDKIITQSLKLADVLLNEDTLVYEPLWAVVTSNKAILAILWELYHENKYLLNTKYHVTDKLKQTGYVVKPIAGRCGFNISIVDEENSVLSKTGGVLDYQDEIYQALCKLPVIANYHTQISSFTANGIYAASCIRAEKSSILTKDSDIVPLRVISDSEF